MTHLVISIYNYLLRHRAVGIVSFMAVTAALLFLMLRLQYKENIADFLPLDSSHQLSQAGLTIGNERIVR